MTTFSVLMSVYKNDAPEYLKLALSSVLEGQTVQPDELVIVKDGKVSDDLDSVIESLGIQSGKTQIKCVELPSNVGLGLALKEGATHCTGDYIVRMDADDISVPERMALTKEFAKLHPEADAFGGYISEFAENPGDMNQLRVVPLTSDEIQHMGKKRNPMNHVSTCIKRSSLLAVGNYEHLQYLEDYYLWLKMIAHGMTLLNMPKVLVHVRVGNGFISKRSSKARIKGWDYLQLYAEANHLITHREALTNKLVIRAFVHTPKSIKAFVYSSLLRKGEPSSSKTNGDS